MHTRTTNPIPIKQDGHCQYYTDLALINIIHLQVLLAINQVSATAHALTTLLTETVHCRKKQGSYFQNFLEKF